MASRGRVGAQAAHKAGISSLLADLSSSAYINPRLYRITSWTFFTASLLSALGSLTAFSMLTDAINKAAVLNGYQGDLASIGLLDLRNGYTPAAVAFTLSAWGSTGRNLYLVIELIDLTFYHYGYRGAAVVLFNRLSGYLSRNAPPAAARALPLLAAGPVVVAASDLLEDLAQVTTVLLFDAAAPDSPTWRSVAAVASALNQTKWALCRAGAFTFLLTSLAAAALALKEQAMRARKRNE